MVSGIGAAVFAQSVKMLTLKEAEAIALKVHPRISASELSVSAARQTAIQTRSALLPNLYGSFTGALADENTRIAAGGLNNPLILSRLTFLYSTDISFPHARPKPT
jgi:outer membrane protein